MSSPEPKPGILDIQAYVGGGHEAPGANRVIVLSANETPLGPSPKAVSAYEALAGSLHRYPDGDSAELRAAIAERFGCDAARIVCGNGSDELISLLIRSYAGQGDEVLYSRHGFMMYPISARTVGATPVAAPEANYTVDVDAILSRVTPRTRIVFIANPNNPTGSYISTDEMCRLRAGLPDDVLLAIDAAYAEYVTRNDYTSGIELVEEFDNVVMTRTFSKIFGLAALRLGWAYCPPAVADVLNRVRGPFNVTAAAQAAGVAALADIAHTDRGLAHNDTWLPWLTEKLNGIGLTVHPSVGNFILVRFASAEAADKGYEALMAVGVIARQMGGYGLPECIRITVGLEDENQLVVQALKNHLAGS
ncbi:MAG: histidinol-phosphate transaminase [Alphaproteobacteria bacterium]|nr:histidinol-phosphate transaminase [Alphaproteobacteria bacterium]